MFSLLPNKTKKVTSTPFSDFIRHAKSSEKKKVFNIALKAAISEQKKIIAQAQTR